MDQLLTSRLIVPSNTLQTAIADSLTTQKDIDNAIATMKSDLDYSVSELTSRHRPPAAFRLVPRNHGP
jgi:hypothetical protein